MPSKNNLAQPISLPRVGVGVLILDRRNRALRTLRKLPPEAGCWSIVGGKLEYLETLHDCALREALEEVGVAISIEGLLCVTDHLSPQGKPALGIACLFGSCSQRPRQELRAAKNQRRSLVSTRSAPPNLTMTARNAINAYICQFPQPLNHRAR